MTLEEACELYSEASSAIAKYKKQREMARKEIMKSLHGSAVIGPWRVTFISYPDKYFVSTEELKKIAPDIYWKTVKRSPCRKALRVSRIKEAKE